MFYCNVNECCDLYTVLLWGGVQNCYAFHIFNCVLLEMKLI